MLSVIELLIAAVILIAIGVGIYIYTKEAYVLQYLSVYEDQDQYQRRPSIWPVVDTATTARFRALREAIEREKRTRSTIDKDAVLDEYWRQPDRPCVRAMNMRDDAFDF